MYIYKNNTCRVPRGTLHDTRVYMELHDKCIVWCLNGWSVDDSLIYLYYVKGNDFLSVCIGGPKGVKEITVACLSCGEVLENGDVNLIELKRRLENERI